MQIVDCKINPGKNLQSIICNLPSRTKHQEAVLFVALPRRLGFVPVESLAPEGLTHDQIDSYNEQGDLMPFDGHDAAEAREL